MILTILRIMFLRLRNNPLELVLVFVMPVVFFSIFAGIFSLGCETDNLPSFGTGFTISEKPIDTSKCGRSF